MPTVWRFLPQLYRDSVSLMQVSARLGGLPGVRLASAQMGTAANLALLRESGTLNQDLPAQPDDLLVVLAGDGDLEALLEQAERELRAPSGPTATGGETSAVPRSIAEATRATPADWALISVPGDYAAAEALKALACGLDVMLFSDNVPLEQEIALKIEAGRRGRLMLGPDCGSTLWNGAALGFANQVRRGSIGVVSASGTGLQEVTSLLSRWGSGILHALGTGGRDLKDGVDGRTALAAIDRLVADPGLKCLLFVSKPPSAAVRERLVARFQALAVPVVACFLGSPAGPTQGMVHFASTLEDAARAAFLLVEGRPAPKELVAEPAVHRRHRVTGHLRGLYSGGTLCAEAAWLLAQSGLPVNSNVSVPGVLEMTDLWHLEGHALLDLGEDEFTRGRAHPMIDPAYRLQRLVEESARPDTRLILMDVVLGYGSHPDPAGAIARVVETLSVGPDGLVPQVWACVTGTDDDSQSWSRSIVTLTKAGVRCFGSNAALIRAAVEALT